ncbi:MAG: hypothetical protein D6709_04150 [Chloroflexi bacterium]|jgi:hypothetical protein|uniref:Uncharacterized protein n=1 Tax=Candidatus Thermofonsia Clade 3 bacterium TaxID=2364212 RepID=A0A2M8QBE1_9CHLR|nr:hypothetical protein [Candidatus Roseilinea sp. NK_OTU-006]PJF47112.1 MAG: hypothetical protein CUN48_10360 [Candidatus Thermofonsia Clade 3 bacterium]RMG64951.1 MAG: hypothetical protein D6709_04150 [Chloroflexota bacterium]
MTHTTSKLTPEDIAWLERRLSAAVAPVAPRPEFVSRAKQELMGAPVVHPRSAWVKRSVLAAAALSTFSLVAMLAYLRRHRRAPSVDRAHNNT